MQATLTHQSATRKSVEIVLPAAEVSEAYSKVLAELAPKAKIAGFRPGKAPKSVLMSRYQQEILHEVATDLVKAHFMNATKSVGAEPISQPSVEPPVLVEGQEGKLTLHFDVAPEVTLPDYKGLAFTKQKRQIDEAAIGEQIEALRQQAARFVPVEDAAAAIGLIATLDIKIKPQGMKGQNYQDQVIELSDERPFDKEVLGLKIDESRQFSLTMPGDVANPEVAGKAVAYEVTLKDLRKREIPEANDDLAKDLGDYENLAALKASVEKDLNEAAERDAQIRLESAILEKLLEITPFEAPDSMVSLQLDDYCNEFARTISRRGVDPKKINWNAYRQTRIEDARKAVRSGYLLQAIGNAEEITVTEEELDTQVKDFMAEHDVQQPLEAFKAELMRHGSLAELQGRARTEKIFAKLSSYSTVTEELLDKEAFEKLVELERRREMGIPAARFDAGGLEGGELESQEGGEPAAVASEEA
ncbi:trigger factor [Holophaga foetida]|uniref:trigger factor n=1 Tax=Holophaga foetida TaxID=35839 RepID=UPI0002473307|nr:trigger factor [Holophaga foetida]